MARTHLLIGDEQGGLKGLSSLDGGQSWGTPQTLRPEVEAVAFETGADGVVYMGTRGDGLLSSRDDLRSWQPVREAKQLEKIRSLAWDNDHLLIGTEPAGVYEYVPDESCEALGDIWSCEGSSNWSYPVKIEAVHIRGLSADPHQKGRLYAAIQVGGVGISPDHGDTWYDKRNLDLDVHVVKPHSTQPGVVYAGSGGGGLYQSTDFGESWECISEGCGQFVLDFAIDPRDPDRLFLGTARGGVRSWAEAPGARGEMFRSDDGGRSWKKLSGGLPEQMQSRVTAILIDRADPNQIYFAGGLPGRANVPMHANDAGVYHSRDGGESWTQVFSLEHGEPPAIWCVHTQ